MKTILSLLLILTICCHRPAHAGLKPYDAAAMHYETSPDQAAVTIRAWAGDPLFALTLTGVYVVTDMPGYENYIYSSPQRQTFYVNVHTGYLWYWTDATIYNAYQAALKSNPSGQQGQSQMELAAVASARQHYSNFDALKMQEYSYNNGAVMFYSQPAPGVWFKGNMCAVSVNSYTGEAWRYMSTTATTGVTISTNATFSPYQAESIALNWLTAPRSASDPAYGADPVLSAFTVQPSELWVVNDKQGKQRLVWQVYAAKNTSIPGYTYSQWVQNDYDLADSCTVSIDANTGEVATYEELLGGEKPMNTHKAAWRSRVVYKSLDKKPPKHLTPLNQKAAVKKNVVGKSHK